MNRVCKFKVVVHIHSPSVPRRHYFRHFAPVWRRTGVRPRYSAIEEPESSADFYSILGVAPNADVAEIKRAYLALMKEFHPDKGGADEFAILLNEVYEVGMLRAFIEGTCGLLANFKLAVRFP